MYITCSVADNFSLRRYIFKQTGLFPENHFHELGDVGDVQIAVAIDVAGGGACGQALLSLPFHSKHTYN